MIDTDDIYTKYAERVVIVGNPKLAAQEVGVPADSVNEFLGIAKTHPDVIRILAEDEMAVPDFDDADSVKKYLLKQLMKESQYKGPGSNATARIAALKTMGELTGVEPAKKIDLNTKNQGGLMMVPVMDAQQWEVNAEQSQADLKKKARE